MEIPLHSMETKLTESNSQAWSTDNDGGGNGAKNNNGNNNTKP